MSTAKCSCGRWVGKPQRNRRYWPGAVDEMQCSIGGKRAVVKLMPYEDVGAYGVSISPDGAFSRRGPAWEGFMLYGKRRDEARRAARAKVCAILQQRAKPRRGSSYFIWPSGGR